MSVCASIYIIFLFMAVLHFHEGCCTNVKLCVCVSMCVLLLSILILPFMWVPPGVCPPIPPPAALLCPCHGNRLLSFDMLAQIPHNPVLSMSPYLVAALCRDCNKVHVCSLDLAAEGRPFFGVTEAPPEL